MTTITTSVGSPGTIGSASGGRVYAFNNISTTPQQIVGAFPQRQNISVHNPGTVTIYVAPKYVQNTGSDVVLVPSNAALGGCYAILPYSTVIISGECQKPWQAFAASGTTNPLTVSDSTI